MICRVNGQSFRAKITNGISQDYAVLQMGTQCPADSFPFSKYIDNEDDQNRNQVTGDIQPSRADSNSALRFCLFRSAIVRPAMDSWPHLGMNYSVFGNPVGPNETFGNLYSNDENDDNENRYSVSADWATSAKRIVTDGRNTNFRVVRAPASID